LKRWNCCKADWKHFGLLACEYFEKLPPVDISNIERAYQDFARACYLRPNNVSHVTVERTMCHVRTKSVRPFITPSSEPQWGLTPIQSLCPYFFGSYRRSTSDGKKLSMPSTSFTPTARHGSPSINLMARLDTPHTSTPSPPTQQQAS